jgi:parallel beta-helix repeat protein
VWTRVIAALAVAGVALAVVVMSSGRPTLGVTVDPTATPSPAPTRTAAPQPTTAGPVVCPSSLQALVNAAPAGSVLTVPPCVYRQSISVKKPLTINGYGAVIDGRDVTGKVVRATWMTISADDVTVAGFTMRYARNAPQTGALRVTKGRSNVVLDHLDLSFATGAAVSFGDANQSSLIDSTVHDNGQLGVHLGGDGGGVGLGNRVAGSHIYHNNTAGFDPEWEAGGLKATQQTGLVLEDNEVDDNVGPGLWCDIYCSDVVVRNNRVHDNTYAGIMFEVSTGARIYGNDVWSNGSGKAVWGWGAGILISSAGGAEVYDNVLAWNARSGVSVISQDRTDWPDAHPIDNFVHDNVTAALANTWLMFWGEDWPGPMFQPASDNRALNNRYWAPSPEDGAWRFTWAGQNTGSLSAFAATPGGQGARYVSTAELTAILAAQGMPTTAPAALAAPTAAPVAQPAPTASP